MSSLVVAVTAAAAVLLTGAAGAAVTTGPQRVVPGSVIEPLPEPVLPEPTLPDRGCTVPVGALEQCPSRPSRPQVDCLLPVGDGAPGVLEPDCAPYDPSPQGRVVPVLPLSH